MYSTSKDKTSVALNHRMEAVSQPVAVSGPTAACSPLLLQHRVMCCEEDLSDEVNSANSANTVLFHRPSKSEPVTFSDASQKSDSVVVFAASSFDGDREDGGSSDITTALCDRFTQGEDGLPNKSEAPDSELRFLPIHHLSDQKSGVSNSVDSGPTSLTIVSENCANQNDEQLESKHSPKLEHEALIQVKGMTSKSDDSSLGLAPSQLPSKCTACGRKPGVAAGLMACQFCKEEDASEFGDICTGNTVILRRNDRKSFGLDLEIISSPLKLIVAGLEPGGAAEMVGGITAIHLHVLQILPNLCFEELKEFKNKFTFKSLSNCTFRSLRAGCVPETRLSESEINSYALPPTRKSASSCTTFL